MPSFIRRICRQRYFLGRTRRCENIFNGNLWSSFERPYKSKPGIPNLLGTNYSSKEKPRDMTLVGKLKTMLGSAPAFIPYDKPVDWQKPYDTLRAKWKEIPTTNSEIMGTAQLLALSDD